MQWLVNKLNQPDFEHFVEHYASLKTQLDGYLASSINTWNKAEVYKQFGSDAVYICITSLPIIEGGKTTGRILGYHVQIYSYKLIDNPTLTLELDTDKVTISKGNTLKYREAHAMGEALCTQNWSTVNLPIVRKHQIINSKTSKALVYSILPHKWGPAACAWGMGHGFMTNETLVTYNL